jgi:hypothetical protein
MRRIVSPKSAYKSPIKDKNTYIIEPVLTTSATSAKSTTSTTSTTKSATPLFGNVQAVTGRILRTPSVKRKAQIDDSDDDDDEEMLSISPAPKKSNRGGPRQGFGGYFENSGRNPNIGTKRPSNQRSHKNNSSEKPINVDAKAYEKNYESATEFVECAICGFEGPSIDCQLSLDCMDLILASQLPTMYDTLTSANGDKYDVSYASAVKDAFLPCGLLKHVTRVCSECCKHLKKSKTTSKKTKTKITTLAPESGFTNLYDDNAVEDATDTHTTGAGMGNANHDEEDEDLGNVEGSM